MRNRRGRSYSIFRVSGSVFERFSQQIADEARDISMPLEILHGALVLFGGGARFEGAQVATLAGLWIDLAGIEAILS
jgi:hypothetical protein